MRKNASYRAFNLNLTPKENDKASNKPLIDYKKFVYVNHQNNKKQNATIFHSPYKNGKKNTDYSNPSFMSSDIFYSKNQIFNFPDTQPKIAIQFNKNDLRRKQISQQRVLKKSVSEIKLQKKQSENNLCLKESTIRKLQNNNLLLKQLTQLKNQKTLSRSKSKPKQNKATDQPVYFQKNYAENIQAKVRNKKQLLNYFKNNLTHKEQDKENRRNQKRKQKKMIDEEANRFYANVISSLEFQRERARLLNELLNEQMNQKR